MPCRHRHQHSVLHLRNNLLTKQQTLALIVTVSQNEHSPVTAETLLEIPVMPCANTCNTNSRQRTLPCLLSCDGVYFAFTDGNVRTWLKKRLRIEQTGHVSRHGPILRCWTYAVGIRKSPEPQRHCPG